MVVHKIDRDKLVFVAPDDRKYCVNVMPFGLANAPPFYIAMMKDLNNEWGTLFILRVLELKTFKDNEDQVNTYFLPFSVLYFWDVIKL